VANRRKPRQDERAAWDSFAQPSCSGKPLLRQGEANPVHLLDLVRSGEREWGPVCPHQCRDDRYSAVLLIHDDCILLRWEVTGPRKRETIEYEYR
jgi:hypothetical protein